ncbi:hypothetical protein CDAR_85901 [Caerostris darwini]|uniref:Uncharacterized protein n=1 Tax=Caerostris darwini TaxID=1538125 RepID=A0AAV4RR45_9ARAC|nr:hypothetical protein CDAR_85901 [Caerostris darwini]
MVLLKSLLLLLQLLLLTKHSVLLSCGRASSRWYFADPRLGSDSRNRRSKSPILSLLQIPEKVKLQQVIQTSSSLQEDKEKCNKRRPNAKSIEEYLTSQNVLVSVNRNGNMEYPKSQKKKKRKHHEQQ